MRASPLKPWLPPHGRIPCSNLRDAGAVIAQQLDGLATLTEHGRMTSMVTMMVVVAPVIAMVLGCANTNRSHAEEPSASIGEPASASIGEPASAERLGTEPTSEEVGSVDEPTSDFELPSHSAAGVEVPEPEVLKYPEEALEMTEQVANIFKKYEGKARCKELAAALNTWADQNEARYRAVTQIRPDKRYDYDEKRMSATMDAMVDGMLACLHVPKVKEAMLRIS